MNLLWLGGFLRNVLLPGTMSTGRLQLRVHYLGEDCIVLSDVCRSEARKQPEGQDNAGAGIQLH